MIEHTVGPVTVIWDFSGPDCEADDVGYRQCPCFDCQQSCMDEAADLYE